MKSSFWIAFSGIMAVLLAALLLVFIDKRQPAASSPLMVTDTITITNTTTVPVVEPSLITSLEQARKKIRQYQTELDSAMARLAELDSLSMADSTSCMAQMLLLKKRVGRLSESLAVARMLIDALNDEAKPKKDTGTYAAERYRLDYSIAYSGRIAPGGFSYKLSIYDLPPLVPVVHKNHIVALTGMMPDGRLMYGVQYGRNAGRFQGVIQTAYPAGIAAGIGVRW